MRISGIFVSKKYWINSGVYASVFLLVFLFLFYSCTGENNPKVQKEKENTHTSGVLKMQADDVFRPILGTTIETFEAIYPDAKIDLTYGPQEQTINQLLKGSIDLVVSGRPLSKEEEERVKKKGLIPKVTKIASDALVFITSKNNPEKAITKEKISEILSGKNAIQLVCDKSNSGNLLYLKEKFGQTIEFQNIAAAGSDSAVIEYVINHPQSIGIIGMTLVSDYDDRNVQNRLRKVNLLAINYKDSTGATKEGYPVQEELITGNYPFIREIFVINLDGQKNLGTGFANFVAGEQGQRIILKAGLMPSRMPGREIIIN